MTTLNYLDIERRARHLQSEEVRRLLGLAMGEIRRALQRKHEKVSRAAAIPAVCS